MRYPPMYRVRQSFETHRVSDVAAAVRSELERIDAAGRVGRAGTVAVALGSRGIRDVVTVAREVVRAIRLAGAEPVIVPAMGSHGGATAAGQEEVLRHLGLSEEALGAPIGATMETVMLGTTAHGMPVHVDRIAAAADAIVIVNRVKPHTSFSGRVESGLAKMLLFGLGNRDGAAACHAAALTHPFDDVIAAGLPMILDRVAFGVAIVEDAFERTAVVEAVPADTMLDREPELLRQARAWMPRLPLDDVDLLIVDEIGKHLSGQGMDSNVTGRKAGASGPSVTRLFVRDLGAASGGNAHGIGHADVTTTRLVEAADWQATWVNTLTSGFLECGRIPPHFGSDREAIDAVLATIGLRPPGEARIVRIRNTLDLEVVEVSEPCLAEGSAGAPPTVEAGPYALAFDGDGNLPPLAP